MTRLMANPRAFSAPASDRVRHGRWLALGIVMLLILAAGVTLGRATAPQPSAPAAAPTLGGPGPRRVVEGVPVSYSRTQEGAIAAAANYTAVLGDKRNLDPVRAVRAYDVLALPSVARELSSRSRAFSATLANPQTVATDPALVLRAVPVGYRVEDYTRDEATVTVWAAAIGVGTPALPLTTAWGNEQLALRWAHGDWKIARIERGSGPAPPQPYTEADGAGIARRMHSFEPFVYQAGNGS